jgi:hypothetical protein
MNSNETTLFPLAAMITFNHLEKRKNLMQHFAIYLGGEGKRHFSVTQIFVGWTIRSCSPVLYAYAYNYSDCSPGNVTMYESYFDQCKVANLANALSSP